MRYFWGKPHTNSLISLRIKLNAHQFDYNVIRNKMKLIPLKGSNAPPEEWIVYLILTVMYGLYTHLLLLK